VGAEARETPASSYILAQVFSSSRADLDRTSVENWLRKVSDRKVSELVAGLTAPVGDDSVASSVASVAVGFGPTFFVDVTAPMRWYSVRVA